MSDITSLGPDGPDGTDGTGVGPIDLEALNRSITLASRMGIVVVEASSERVVGTMPVEGNTQPPRSSAVVSSVRPVALFRTLILAPGTAAPRGSVTVPSIRPVVTCDQAARENRHRIDNVEIDLRITRPFETKC